MPGPASVQPPAQPSAQPVVRPVPAVLADRYRIGEVIGQGGAATVHPTYDRYSSTHERVSSVYDRKFHVLLV